MYKDYFKIIIIQIQSVVCFERARKSNNFERDLLTNSVFKSCSTKRFEDC